MVVPLAFSMIKIKGHVSSINIEKKDRSISSKEKTLIFGLGLACLLFVTRLFRFSQINLPRSLFFLSTFF